MRQTIPLPAPPVCPLCARSLQVVASPCWAMALPDIISATLVQVLGPIPRRAPRLHLSIPSPRTPASPHGKRVRRADLSPHGSFRGEPYFVAAVIRSSSGSCTRSAPRLLRPRRLRAGPPGLSHHASPGRLPEPGCGVATCSTWTTSMAGLSPAGSQPCRLLPPAHGSSESCWLSGGQRCWAAAVEAVGVYETVLGVVRRARCGRRERDDHDAVGGQPVLPFVRELWPVCDGVQRSFADRAAPVLGSMEPQAGVVDRQRRFASSLGPA